MNTKHSFLMLSVMSAWLFSALAYANTFTIINNTDKPIEIVEIDRIELNSNIIYNVFNIELRQYVDLRSWRSLTVCPQESQFSTRRCGAEGPKIIFSPEFDARGFVTEILKPGESKTGSYQYLRGPDENFVRGQIWLEKNKIYSYIVLQSLFLTKLRVGKEVRLQTDLRRVFNPVKQVTIIK